MDLTTSYLGLELAHPVLPGASPLADSVDGVRRLEDAGAPAIVLRSLFEEQFDPVAAMSPELGPLDFPFDPEGYLEHVRKVRAAVAVPVFASLNGSTPGGWLSWARRLEEAGADAVELNLYHLGADPTEAGPRLESETLAMVQAVSEALLVPLVVKLSPFYTSLAHFAAALDEAGAEGLVLFNRFAQADIAMDQLELLPTTTLSDRSELLLRLHWLAILAGRTRASLACSGGVQEPLDVVKALACGADVVQVVSELLRHGPRRLGALRDGLSYWLEEREYDALSDLRGSMSLARQDDPERVERLQYLRILGQWRR